MTKRFFDISHVPTRRQCWLGAGYLLFEILLLPVILGIGALLLPLTPSDAQINFVFFCVNFAAVFLIFRKFLQQNLALFLRRPSFTLQSAFFGFLLFRLGSALVAWLALWVDPQFSNVNDGSIAVLLGQDFTLMAIGTVLLVPVVEETLFRGMVFASLLRRSPLLAYGLSAALFSAIHVYQYLGAISSLTALLFFLQYIPAGLALAWAYRRCGSILAPILIHMTVNATGILSLR